MIDRAQSFVVPNEYTRVLEENGGRRPECQHRAGRNAVLLQPALEPP